MDVNKSEPVNQPASYKVIAEKDMEEEAVTRPKSLVKSKPTTPEADGADEKMLAKEEKISISETKSSPNEKQNGDAKLDIGDLKQAFVGLTKEELMKYAEDPFWVRLRWFLFITFWLLWFAMLVGAVMIIYAAPKCDPPPPRTWSQEGPLTKVTFDIKSEEIDSLITNGVKGAIVSFPDDCYADIDESHKIVQFLKENNKENGLKVIVELEPGNSNLWFSKSEGKKDNFLDYYIWKVGNGTSEDPKPPNNWLTVNNTSSWKYSQLRKEYYYAPTGKPHLNFYNPNVVQEFNKVLRKFLEYGAKGIQLKGVPRLLSDNNFENEVLMRSSNPNFVHTDYGFYSHSKTENLLALGPLLKQWNLIVKNKTVDGPLMASEDLHNIEAYKDNTSLVIDLPINSHLFTKPNLNATAIVSGLNNTFKVNQIQWPLWKYTPNDALDIVTFLLPGVPLVEKDASINSTLLKMRSSPSIMRGSFDYYEVSNKTVFAYVRVTSGNPGFLVAYNPTDTRVVVDFPKEIKAVSQDVTVQLFSRNYNESDVFINTKQEAHKIPISANSTIVLSYVPKQN